MKKIKTKEVALGLIAQTLQVGIGLFILPIALIKLQSSELGLWYIFFAVQSLVSLLDLGFTPTFARTFAYIFGGVQRLSYEGLPNAQNGNINGKLLAATILGAQRVYIGLSIGAAILLASLGTPYICHLAGGAGIACQKVLVPWSIFGSIVVANIYLQWQTSLLQGADRVIQTYKISIFSRIVQLLSSIVGLAIYPSILSLVISYGLATLVTRFCTRYYLKDILSATQVFKSEVTKNDQSPNEIIRLLWYNSGRLGLVFVGSFLILRFNTFAVAHFLGLAVAAQYAVASQAIMVIAALGQVAFNIHFPQFTAARAQGDLKHARKILSHSLIIAWVLFLVLSSILMSIGPFLLKFIGSKTELPDLKILALLSIVLLLELNHSICANAIVAGNRIPFIRSALLSGTAIAFGTVCIGYLGFDLIYFIAVQGIIQIAYNNWKWPMVIYRDLKQN